MNKYWKVLGLVLVFALLFLVYKSWFISPVISAGDSWYFFKSMFDNHSIYPYAWYTVVGNGLGGQGFPFQNINILLSIPFELAKALNLDWEIVSKIFFYIPFIILSTFSSIFFIKKIFPRNKFWFISPIIFVLNTYILMTAGGGQIALALAYSISPLVVYLFIKQVEIKDKKTLLINTLLVALLFSLQTLFDLRFAYVTLAAVFLYFISISILNRTSVILNVVKLISPLVITSLIHAFWIIPILVFGLNPIKELGSDYSSSGIINFLSFARLENSMGLLHPYWSENIFGKSYFMRPEFLIIPILAYSSLLFIQKIKDQRTKHLVLFFAFLGLIGVFLGKGGAEPFGNLYIWLFKHVPGFQLFRDSLKWYTLTAISYSILIPFTVLQVYEFLKVRKHVSINFKFLNLSKLFLILTTLYLILLIRPAIFGELNGTFKNRNLPKEYIQLENFLDSDKNFYRTLWIPNTMLFGYYTNNHPQVSARDFFKEYDHKDLIKILAKQNSEKDLDLASVKYVIVPFDTEKEIFLTDRKYDDKKYQDYIHNLDKIPWLEMEKKIGKVIVYKTQSYKDLFWCNCKAEINYKFINPTKYLVSVKNARKGEILIYSQNYNQKWVIKDSFGQINSIPYEKRYNSFELPGDGEYRFEVYYYPQIWVDRGILISIITLAGSILILFIKAYPSRWKGYVH